MIDGCATIFAIRSIVANRTINTAKRYNHSQNGQVNTVADIVARLYLLLAVDFTRLNQALLIERTPTVARRPIELSHLLCQ